MNKKLLVFLMIFTCSSARAQIPVTDVAGLAQAVQTVAEAQKMVAEAKRQYNQVESNFNANMDAIKGNDWGYLANQLDNNYDFIPLEDWNEIENIDVSSLRVRYGLQSADAEEQAVYDQKLRYLAANEAAYKSQKQHLSNIEALQNRAGTVSTPQQREELNNAITLEVAAMQSDKNRIDTINQNMNRDAQLRESAANQELRNMFQ